MQISAAITEKLISLYMSHNSRLVVDEDDLMWFKN